MEKIVISFSGGATSAYMTERLLADERAGLVTVEHILFCNTGKEHEATLLFVQNCGDHWGRQITWLEYAGKPAKTPKGTPPAPYYNIVDYKTASRNGEPFERLIRERKYLPNAVTRYCTQELKIRCMEHFLKDRGQFDLRQAVGIRYDEPRRYHRIKVQDNKYMPLWGWRVTKEIVDGFWASMPFRLNIPRRLGNCDFCYLKGYKNRLLIAREYPEVLEWWARMESLVTDLTGANKLSQKLKKLIAQKPHLEEFILQARKYERNASFDKDHSVAQIKELVSSMQAADFDNIADGGDIDCACTID